MGVYLNYYLIIFLYSAANILILYFNRFDLQIIFLFNPKYFISNYFYFNSNYSPFIYILQIFCILIVFHLFNVLSLYLLYFAIIFIYHATDIFCCLCSALI